jgi:hypothetical protein
MKSHINDDFLKVYRRLPEDVREQARKAIAYSSKIPNIRV